MSSKKKQLLLSQFVKRKKNSNDLDSQEVNAIIEQVSSGEEDETQNDQTLTQTKRKKRPRKIFSSDESDGDDTENKIEKSNENITENSSENIIEKDPENIIENDSKNGNNIGNIMDDITENDDVDSNGETFPQIRNTSELSLACSDESDDDVVSLSSTDIEGIDAEKEPIAEKEQSAEKEQIVSIQI